MSINEYLLTYVCNEYNVAHRRPTTSFQVKVGKKVRGTLFNYVNVTLCTSSKKISAPPQERRGHNGSSRGQTPGD